MKPGTLRQRERRKRLADSGVREVTMPLSDDARRALNALAMQYGSQGAAVEAMLGQKNPRNGRGKGGTRREKARSS